jgi:diguanylate cyclase
MSGNTQEKSSPDRAREFAIQSIDLLLEHGLPPGPLHYAVAYEYLNGGHPDLKKFLDQHLGEGKPLDAILVQDLYERYLASAHHQQFQGMRNNLHDILQSLLQTIAETSDNNEEYQRELESNLRQLGLEQDQSSLQKIAADMISAAMASQFQNGKLQSHLLEARKEAEQLREELEAQRLDAMVDPLTGLFNRRAMDHHLEYLWKEDQNLSVLVMDIDHFKRINDSYGHAIGDIVIRNVADAVRKCIRGEDIAIRYGGEEFLVLLPNTHLEGAVTVAEAIRKRIEALRLVRKNDNFALAPFTISLGVAKRRDGDDRDSLFERADKALYQAKTSGRNRVIHENHLN